MVPTGQSEHGCGGGRRAGGRHGSDGADLRGQSGTTAAGVSRAAPRGVSACQSATLTDATTSVSGASPVPDTSTPYSSAIFVRPVSACAQRG